MAILTFEQKHDFWKRPFNLSTQNLLCIEYGHLDLSRHDLGKALLFCPSKIYSALYVHPDFTTNFNMIVFGIYLGYLVYLSTWATVLDPNPASYRELRVRSITHY